MRSRTREQFDGAAKGYSLPAKQYEPHIDGLRALAVLAVIINHLSAQALPSGFLGVDIFFVISGYVITRSLDNRGSEKLSATLKGFYVRRLKRLFPALMVCVLITGVLSSLFNPEPLESLQTGIASLFGLSNFYLLFNATNYFGDSADLNFFTHTWSLGVEEQFYLVFPLVYLLSRGVRPSSGDQRFLLGLLVTLVVLSAYAFVVVSISHPSRVFYMMPFRFWELGSGCILALMISPTRCRSRIPSFLRSELVLLLLVGVLFSPEEYLIVATIGVVFLSLLLIASFHSTDRPIRILAHPFVVYLGLISYSLYLWHWSVIVLSRWTIGLHWWSVPFQAVLILVLAAMSHRFIEKPFRYGRWNAKPLAEFGYGLALSIVVSFLLTSLVDQSASKYYLGGQKTDYEEKTQSTLLKEFKKNAGFDPFLTRAQKIQKECNMTPHLLSGNNYRPAPVLDDKFAANCLGTDKSKVILIGDSFASAVFTHVVHATYSVGYDFAMIYGYGCPFPLDLNNLEFAAKTTCKIPPDFLRTSLEKNLNPGDVMVLRLFFQKNEYLSFSKNDQEKAVYAYDIEIRNLLRLAKSHGVKLIIIGSNGEMQSCNRREWFNRLQCPRDIDMSSGLGNQYAMLHNSHLGRLSQYDAENFAVISPTRIMCSMNSDSCPIENSNRRFMRDNVHLSASAIDLLYPEILARIQNFAKATH